MRIVLGLLVLANLGFFAWAHWIAPGTAPPADPLKPAVPRLLLAREIGQPQESSSAASDAAKAAPGATAAAPLRAAIQCVTIGPFAVRDAAWRAAAAFRSDGYEPVQRQVEAELADGFWVYIGGVESPAMQQSLVRRLQESGMTDAHEMPRSAAGLRVSVGIFSERARAVRRAAEVNRLGLKAEVAEHTRPATVYWLDIKPRSGSPELKAEELASLNQGGGGLTVEPCPGAEAAASGDRVTSPEASAPEGAPARSPAASVPDAPSSPASPPGSPAPRVSPGAAAPRTASG